MKVKLTLVAIASLLLVSACAERSSSTTASLALNQPQQFSAVRWDELAAAHRAAEVNNNALIQMR